MYAKRFIQLFIIFLITVFVAMYCVKVIGVEGYFYQSLILTVIGYIILIVPLTALTIMKQKKKFSLSTNTNKQHAFQSALEKLENIVIVSTLSNDGMMTSSILTFKQSKQQENVWYVVTDKKSKRVQNIHDTKKVSLTTWFDKETGIRISSNNIMPTVLENDALKDEIVKHGEIKELADNFNNKVIIRLDIQSVLVESFRTNPTVISFQD